MRLAEVAEADRAIDCGQDLAEPDLAGRPGEHIAAAHTPFRAHQAGTLQCEEDLLEIRLGETGSRSDVPHGGRSRVVTVEGE